MRNARQIQSNKNDVLVVTPESEANPHDLWGIETHHCGSKHQYRMADIPPSQTSGGDAQSKLYPSKDEEEEEGFVVSSVAVGMILLIGMGLEVYYGSSAPPTYPGGLEVGEVDLLADLNPWIVRIPRTPNTPTRQRVPWVTRR